MAAKKGNGSSEDRIGPMPFDGVPESVLVRFTQSSSNGDEPEVTATADVSAEGEFGLSWLVASQERVWVVTPNGNDSPHISEWRTSDISKAEAKNHVGIGALEADIDGDHVELVRYSNTLQRQFNHVAKHLNSLAEDGRVAEISDTEIPRYCPKCGRLVSRKGGGICPACLDRRKILMRLTTYLKPHVGAAVYMVALTAGVAVMEMIPIYLTTKVLIDDLLKGGGVTTITLIPGLWTVNVESWGLGVFTWLAILISVIVCVRVTMVAFSVLQSRISVMLGLSVTRDLRSTVYQHLQRLSVSFHDKMRVGTLMSRVLTDVSRVNGFLVSGVPHMGVVLLRLIAIGALLFLMNPFLAACILIPIPLVIYFSRLFYRRMGGLFHRQAQRYSLMSATINDAMNGVRVVKAFGQEDRELEKFGGRNEDWYSAGLKAEQSFFTFYPFIGFLMTSGAFIVYYFGGLDVVAGTMTLGTLLAFVAYLIQFYQPVQWLSRINDWITRDLTAAERIFEVLDTAPEVADHPKALAVDKLEGTVRFENVAFGYDPLEPVLQNVDVEVKQGEMVGLVGRSGAGKSTLINLVCRFYDPQEGRITIDGTDLREIKLDEWHSRLGIVPQESFLFHGTISENIAYAHPEATREDVIRAARAANAHNFISRFPDGYDGVVGERGTRLSGGERQRIAIARAILHDPKVLILDEATSSVDTETEQRIQEALRNLVKDRTVFAIAHRLSTLKFANRLIVIDDGKVAEFGTHDELIEKQGIYYGLVAAQTEMSKITAVGG